MRSHLHWSNSHKTEGIDAVWAEKFRGGSRNFRKRGTKPPPPPPSLRMKNSLSYSIVLFKFIYVTKEQQQCLKTFFSHAAEVQQFMQQGTRQDNIRVQCSTFIISNRKERLLHLAFTISAYFSVLRICLLI